MLEQLLKTWSINENMLELLINNISDTGFEKTLSTRGGRTIAQQLIHIHNVRMQWLEICSKDIHKKFKVLEKDKPTSKKELIRSFKDSSKGIAELFEISWNNNGVVKGFKGGVIPMLGYFISHESHHRGTILLTLKQTGEKIPEAVKWGLWEWSK